MNNQKLVTIGTSLYNKAPYLKDWAESLAKQTYLDKMFILVVEDCSTDNSLELLKKYVKEYHLPVKILKNKKNMGVVYATQRIYENLRTKYFAILDADDFYFSPERIERGVKFLESHNDYSCHISNYILSYSDGRKGTIRPYPPPSDSEKYNETYRSFRELPIYQASSTLFRNFFTPVLLKKVLSHPEGSPETLDPALEGEPLRLLLAARFGNSYFDNFIGAVYRCDVGIFGNSSELEKDMGIMNTYYNLFNFYKNNFGVDDNAIRCLEYAFQFYCKSWDGFSVMNKKFATDKFIGKKLFKEIFKDFEVDTPAGIFSVLNHYGKILSSLIKFKS